MVIYIFLYLSFLLLSIFLGRKVAGRHRPLMPYYYLMIIFIVSSGLRDLIGGYDVYIYRAIYLADQYRLNSAPFEFGFIQYFNFLRLFNSSEYFMFFMTAMIIGLTHFYSIKKYAPYLYLALFIYFCKFYLMSYVYLRQGIAMGIVWYSVRYVLDRKFIKFILIICIGVMFHTSALIFLPVYFLYTNKYKIITYSLWVLFFVLIIFIPVFDPVLSLLSNLNERYESYGKNIDNAFNYLYIAEALVCFIIFLLYYGKVSEKKHILMFNGFFIYIIIQLLSVKMGIFIRLSWYYLLFYCIILSSFIERFEFTRKVYKPLLILGFSLLFFRLLLVWDDGDFIPYKSIFDDTQRRSIWQYLK